MAAYSMEFRQAAAAAYDECGSSVQVAAQFMCSESWVRRLLQRFRESGSLQPRPRKQPDNNRLDDQDHEQLRRLIAQKPDMILEELAAALNNKVSVPTVCRALKKLDLRRKKKRLTPPSRTGPT